MKVLFGRRNVLEGALALGLTGCGRAEPVNRTRSASSGALRLIAAARAQIGVTIAYDPSYTKLSFPNGDVVRGKGVCTDVVIRAYRDAFGIDLQDEVNRDMTAHFQAYPGRWGLSKPDPNIDHRRVPNLQTFWERAGARLPVPTTHDEWLPGDVFTSMVDGRPHTGIVSDLIASNGNPLAIHNIGQGTKEEERLFAYPLTGRFRWRV